MHLEPRDGVGSWTFGFDHAKRRAGLCNYTERRITVSRYLAAKFDDDEVHQVLLHEVAHAMAGHEAGHGPQWKRVAREIGYVGERTHDGEIAHELAPWVGVCPGGHTHARFRRPTPTPPARRANPRARSAHEDSTAATSSPGTAARRASGSHGVS